MMASWLAPLARKGGAADDDLSDKPQSDGGVRASEFRRRVRKAPRSGVFPCFLVADANLPPPVRVSAEDLLIEASSVSRVAVVSLARCEWRFATASDQTRADYEQVAVDGGRRCRGQSPWAYIEYRVLERWGFSDMVPVPDGFDAGAVDAEMCLRRLTGDLHLPTGGSTVKQFFVRRFAGMSVHVVAAHPFRFRGDAPLPLLFRSVPLALRNTFDGVIRDRPPISYVKRWRKELDVTRTAQVPVMVEAHAAEDNWSQVALELPVARARVAQVDVGRRCRGPMFPLHREEDPLQLILGLDFANFLRNKAEFSAALDAAERFRCGWDAPPRPNDGDQQKRTLARTAEALDIVGMNLQRREFRADRLTNSVRAVNLFTDSSPTAGEEIQGMVMELVRTSSEVCRTLLPGSTLVYGQYNAVAKTVALVWSLWLVCGPLFCDMNFLFSKVRCVCTDFGTEQKTIEMPDILKAFLAWRSGRDLHQCKQFINFDRRLLYNALRVGGWSHAYGNLMKALMLKDTRWEDILPQLRELCSFFRNATWRKNIAKRVPPPLKPLLLRFSANMAPWRYETACEVLEDLDAIRPVTPHIRHDFLRTRRTASLSGARWTCVTTSRCGRSSPPMRRMS